MRMFRFTYRTVKEKSLMRSVAGIGSSLIMALFLAVFVQAGEAPRLTLQSDDQVMIVGSGLADRMQHDGWLEAMLYREKPQANLTIRNLGFSGDEVVVRLRTETGRDREEWLRALKATVVLAFYGFNESFAGPAGLAAFKKELRDYLAHMTATAYDGSRPPRLVLFSPIAHELLPDPNSQPPMANNANLALYTAAMAEVASAAHVPFVDLFAASKRLYANAREPLTINGVHLTEVGNRALEPIIYEALFGKSAPAEDARFALLREAVIAKCSMWHSRYRTVDSYNIYGQRSQIAYASGKDGPRVTNAEVMVQEMTVRDVMTANREKRIWSLVQDRDTVVDDSNLPPVKEVVSNLPGVNPDKTHPYLSGEQAITAMTMPEGCKVSLFASEEQFPDLVKPVQMDWDTKGRLWVAVWPNYPERTPTGTNGDKLLVLEDTNGDGKADRCTTFADDLNCPTGFQFFKDGVLVMQSPDLVYMRDTDGDGRADTRERMLMGIDAADSHHASNSMVIDPGGAIYLSDGVFLRSQVETPAGMVRNRDGAIYRYEPLTQRFERYVAYGFHNPHGRVFDYWGNDLISDASINATYFAAAFSGRIDYPNVHPKMREFWKRPMRPCSATTLLSTRHFPESLQNSFLNCNVIGMQGIFRVAVSEDGSGLKGETQENLLSSSDRNFRPVGVSVAPDGSLFILDWSNALIGHAQHHLRDPNRDREHGRIYRMTYEGRPLLSPGLIDGQPVAVLLNQLTMPENNQRVRAKLELAKHAAAEVIPAVRTWLDGLDRSDPAYEHHVLEGLWVHQWFNVVDQKLLTRVLQSPDYRARAAAARVLCYWRDRIPSATALFTVLAGDDHPRVRLEAVRAASFFSGSDVPAAYVIAYTVLKKSTDYYIEYCYQETIRQLRSLDPSSHLPSDAAWATLIQTKEKTIGTELAKEKDYGPTRRGLSSAERASYALGKAVFNRDGHCLTCHQPDGQGVAGIYPPLTNADWLNDHDRLAKIVLKGLWGHIRVGKVTFDPARGIPPMPGFGALLSDDELAGVLTYVRQSFGNNFDPVTPAQVRAVRTATEGKTSFYQPEELMKEHPIAGWETWKSGK